MESPILIPVDPWLAHLEAQIEALRRGDAGEAVHQVRVAAGRLSVWLEMQGRRALRDDLRWLRASATELRDLEVLIAKNRSARWNEWLEARRDDALASVRAAVASPRPKSLLHALACVPAPDERAAAFGLARIQKRVLRAGERIAHDESNLGALHRLRRRTRRLRYALDWMGLDSKDVKDLQDVFGALNDLSVELRHLESVDAGRAFAEQKREVERELEKARANALVAWQELKPSLRVGASRGK